MFLSIIRKSCEVSNTNRVNALNSSRFKLTYSSSIILASNSLLGLKNVTVVTWKRTGLGIARINCTKNIIDSFKCLLFVASSINKLGSSFKYAVTSSSINN